MSMKYDFGAMQQLADEVRADSAALTETHSELTGYVNGLVSEWDGNAQEAYRAVQAEWDAANTELLETLSQIAKAVEQGGQDMAATDARAASTFGG
ncbi:MAG: WXG100 family type VII secretion target [Rhodococcus sp.]|nr:WXG100 family type VII secretion target [Rhodococcus sp. (in: high G+C Gram-positive bacteria)]